MIPDIRVDLHRRCFEAANALPDRLGDVQFESQYDVSMRAMLLRLKTYVWAEHLGTIEVPATWWQHFKQAMFPKWLLRRFPVRMTIHDANRLYPNLSLPNERSVARIFVRRPESWSLDD